MNSIETMHFQSSAAMFLAPLLILAMLATTAFWIWALADCVHNEHKDQGGKIGWIVLIAIFHWVGALCYLIIRRPRRSQQPPP
jgi:hypothetical protein